MSIAQPQITWIGSPYFGYPRGASGRGDYKVIALVDHIMDGSLAGTDAWFNSPDNDGVSAHFGIGKSGEIHQYVKITDVARHAGNVREPSWVLLNPAANPNWYTIGIEHEGHPGEEMPEAQFQASIALHKWLGYIFGLTFNQDTVIGHYRIDSVQRSNCPGPTFPWDRLFKTLALPNPPFPDVPPDHWAAAAIERLAAAGILTGYPDGTYSGDKAVTRYELAVVLDIIWTKLSHDANLVSSMSSLKF